MSTMTPTQRDWAGRTIAHTPLAYINRTGQDVKPFEPVVMAAIAKGGVFGEDLADIFTLTCPMGVWILDFA
jgi:hypothetical protein